MRQLTPAEVANLLGRAIQTQAQFYVGRSSGGQPGQFLQAGGIQARCMEPVPPGQTILVRYGDEWRAFAPRNPAPVVRVVQDVRRRQVVPVVKVRYEFAIIYYKDAGDSKTVWLRDGDAAPVQIATWPKRVPLFEQQTWVQGGGNLQGYVGYIGRAGTSLDDPRPLTRTGALHNSTVDVQVSLLSGFSSIQINFAGLADLTAGFGGGGFYNDSGFFSLPTQSNFSSEAIISVYASDPGSAWSGAFESMSNNYGVIGLVKTPSKTLFSLVDHPAISDSDPPGNDRCGRVIYGQPGEILTASYPSAPNYDPDFNGTFIRPATETYRGGIEIWTRNAGTAVEQPTRTDFDNLIGTEFGTVNVFNFATNVFTENIPIPGIEAGAEKIIAIVALAATN